MNSVGERYHKENRDISSQYDKLFQLIQASLWGIPTGEITRKEFDIMQHHAISLIVGPILSSLQMSSSLRNEWKSDILHQFQYNMGCIYAQNVIPLTMPYIVLKGTSAAKYYPEPEFRALGDIDIMTRREDVEAACEIFLQNDYIETTSDDDKKEGRHRTFFKDGFSIEIHYFFAAMNDPKKAKLFDDLLVDHIDDTCELPDMINGLVLIEHINQHLENGLGLRQIIDWMMFVDKCLSDNRWAEFREYVAQMGLETLTITVTRMCEMFLGLSTHEWARNANEKLCLTLMNYVLESGNFGNQRTIDEKKIYIRYEQSNHPFKSIKELQRKGIREWGKAQNPALRPFAWIWKGFRVFTESLGLKQEFIKAKKRKKMLVLLGVKQKDKGIAVFRDGKYIISD